MEHAKRGYFAYDDNFEFNIYSVRAFSKLQDDWHLFHWNWSQKSGVTNEILLKILTIFLFFVACFHLFLENISATKSPFSVCCITHDMVITNCSNAFKKYDHNNCFVSYISTDPKYHFRTITIYNYSLPYWSKISLVNISGTVPCFNTELRLLDFQPWSIFYLCWKSCQFVYSLGIILVLLKGHWILKHFQVSDI